MQLLRIDALLLRLCRLLPNGLPSKDERISWQTPANQWQNVSAVFIDFNRMLLRKSLLHYAKRFVQHSTPRGTKVDTLAIWLLYVTK